MWQHLDFLSVCLQALSLTIFINLGVFYNWKAQKRTITNPSLFHKKGLWVILVQKLKQMHISVDSAGEAAWINTLNVLWLHTTQYRAWKSGRSPLLSIRSQQNKPIHSFKMIASLQQTLEKEVVELEWCFMMVNLRVCSCWKSLNPGLPGA